MRLSRYFLPVLKETPSEAQIASHRLMLRAGMIKQQSAGIYSWLPLGFKVLSRIEQIVNEEQQRAGHIPLLLPTLQSADLWRESGRYDAFGDELLRVTDGRGADIVLEMLANVNLERDLAITAQNGRIVVIGSRGALQFNPRGTMARSSAWPTGTRRSPTTGRCMPASARASRPARCGQRSAASSRSARPREPTTR